MPETETAPIRIENRTFDSHDEFNRRPVAEKIIRLLTSDIDVSPMVIDGGWGAGKTEFCHKTIKLFEEHHPDVRCIYVDAFKADHADESLMTLLAAVLNEVPDAEKETFKARALPVARFIGSVALKAATGFILKQSTDDIADGWEDAVQRGSNQAIDNLLEDHAAAESNIKALRDTLEELTRESRIVLFIDELDRCRPDFAVAMLENIKHIFDVEGVDFVLVTNSDQLRSAIINQYGGDTSNARRYLDKFIGFTFELPRHIRHTGNNGALASHFHFWAELEKSSTLDAKQVLKADLTFEFTAHLMSHNEVTLREAETWARHIEIYHVLARSSEISADLEAGRHALAVFAIFIFTFHKDLAHEIKRDKLDPAKFGKLLGRDRLKRSNEPNNADFVNDLVGTIAVAAYLHSGPFEISDGKEADYWRVKAVQRFGESFQGTRRRLLQFFLEVFDTFEFGGSQ